jgi:hypothetical protein
MTETEPQLSEHGTEQKQRKELGQKVRGSDHEGLGPVCEKRLACEGCGDKGCGWREKEHAPAAEGEPDKQSEPSEDAEKAHAVSLIRPKRRRRTSNGHPSRRYGL